MKLHLCVSLVSIALVHIATTKLMSWKMTRLRPEFAIDVEKERLTKTANAQTKCTEVPTSAAMIVVRDACSVPAKTYALHAMMDIGLMLLLARVAPTTVTNVKLPAANVLPVREICNGETMYASAQTE